MKILALFLFLIQAAFADTFYPLNTAQEALQSRVDVIQNAKKSIELTYFIWKNDRTGNEILALLRDAARRGVKVRIIVDSMFNKIPKKMKNYLFAEGIEFKDYNRFKLLKKSSWFNRMHNKLVIVDEEILITGGRNIADEYFDLSKKRNYLDRDVLIKGPAVKDALASFNELWVAPHVTYKMKKNVSEQDMKEASEKLDEALVGLETHPFVKLNSLHNWDGPEVSTVKFYHDEVELTRWKRSEPIFDALAELCMKAKKSVVIESAYLVIREDFALLLKDLIKRGVKVRILTNPMASTDGVPAQAAYLGWRSALVRMGVELYEYTGKEAVHIKSGVIDDKFTVIGSYNIDYLSAVRNTEAIAVVEDEGVAKEMRKLMDENLKLAGKVDEYGIVGDTGTKYPGTTRKKRVMTQLVRFLVAPFFKSYF